MRVRTSWDMTPPHADKMPALISGPPVAVVCSKCGHRVDNLGVNGRGRWVTLPCNHEIVRDQ